MLWNQIEAIYKIANYIDDKCPGMGMFTYTWGMDPYIRIRGATFEMAQEVLEPQILEIAKPVNLKAVVYRSTDPLDDGIPVVYVVVGSDLLVWESIFPRASAVPPEAPLEWFIRQLQEQLFPRVTGFTNDLT